MIPAGVACQTQTHTVIAKKPFKRRPRREIIRINERIRVPQIRVIYEDANEVMETKRALKIAKNLGLDLVEGVVDVLETAQPLQQAERGLLADTGHPGDVVGLVAHQRQQVDAFLKIDACITGP